jgi:hypothetical protein
MTNVSANPLHIPSPALRSQVETMAGSGAPQTGIARMIGDRRQRRAALRTG